MTQGHRRVCRNREREIKSLGATEWLESGYPYAWPDVGQSGTHLKAEMFGGGFGTTAGGLHCQ